MIELDFTPSKYQQDIFDFVLHGRGNGIIKACAGSGKTKVLVTSMKLLPKKRKCLFIAFNKSIVDELLQKLDGYDNCKAYTIHSLGYAMLRRNFDSDIEVNEYKYRLQMKKNIGEYIDMENTLFTESQINDYIENVLELVDYSRFNLAQSEKEIRAVALKYDIPMLSNEAETVVKLLEWGKSDVSVVDYTDMVWLPVEMGLNPMGFQFDWIFFDEAQDASLMAISLFRKCIKRGTRVLCAGDPDQSINMFAGSSEDAFEELGNGSKLFTLPITYRCPKKVVEIANRIVDDMIPLDDAIDGDIIENIGVADLRDGDMVLSRCKTPLINLYVRLLRRNVNCYIKGQNIGRNLISLLERIDRDDLNANMLNDGVFTQLYDKLFEYRSLIMKQTGLDVRDATMVNSVMEFYDCISSLKILSEGCSTKSELIDRIDKIFSEDGDGICLSTIHKAKGLEADRVVILCNSSMPSKRSRKEWERKQEVNLQYVAYTRAKKTLAFFSEDVIKPTASLMDVDKIMDELNSIEYLVCKALGREYNGCADLYDYSRYRVENTKPLEIERASFNIVSSADEDDMYNFDEIMDMLQ